MVVFFLRGSFHTPAWPRAHGVLWSGRLSGWHRSVSGVSQIPLAPCQWRKSCHHQYYGLDQRSAIKILHVNWFSWVRSILCFLKLVALLRIFIILFLIDIIIIVFVWVSGTDLSRLSLFHRPWLSDTDRPHSPVFCYACGTAEFWKCTAVSTSYPRLTQNCPWLADTPSDATHLDRGASQPPLHSISCIF